MIATIASTKTTRIWPRCARGISRLPATSGPRLSPPRPRWRRSAGQLYGGVRRKGKWPAAGVRTIGSSRFRGFPGPILTAGPKDLWSRQDRLVHQLEDVRPEVPRTGEG